MKHAGVKPLSYLFACTLISNVANLQVFSSHMLSTLHWIRQFWLPSLVSIASTFAVLWHWFRKDLNSKIADKGVQEPIPFSQGAKYTATGLGIMIIVLLIAPSLEMKLGLPTFISVALTVLVIASVKKEFPKTILKHITWEVMPLMAGLFILVEALNQAGALKITHTLLMKSRQRLASGSLRMF